MSPELHADALGARALVRKGALRGAALVDRLCAVPPHERDAWVDALLALPEAPPDADDLPRGAVPYLPAGVEEILAVVREAPLLPDDRFVDLGSGLGRVAMLAHLLSGAVASGVEIQAELVERARGGAAALGLERVHFVHGDARLAALEANVFFLYAPFDTETLGAVLRRLEVVARRRSLVVCAVDFDLPAQPWLKRRPSSSHALTFYDSAPALVTLAAALG